MNIQQRKKEIRIEVEKLENDLRLAKAAIETLPDKIDTLKVEFLELLNEEARQRKEK